MKLLRNIKSKFSGSTDSRRKSSAERSEDLPPIPESGMVLDGADCASLKSRIYPFKLAPGIHGVAATDRGHGKNPNEDAIVVAPKHHFVAAIDGVGGYWGGEQAARFFGEGLRRFATDFSRAVAYAQEQVQSLKFEDSLKLYGSSACFVSAQFIESDDTRLVAIAQSGDCRLVIFRRNGEILRTEDESYVNELVQKELISEDQSLYHELRNRITNSVRLAFSSSVTENPALIKDGVRKSLSSPVSVQPGDRICLMSDGISDNLTPLELGQIIQDKSPREAVEAISDLTDQRMANAWQTTELLIREYLIAQEGINGDTLNRAMAKIRDHASSYHWLQQAIFHRARHRARAFPDGYASKPSQDNRAISVIDVT